MGFIDFFKKIFSEEKEEVKTTKVSFEELPNFLQSKKDNIKNKENEIYNLIKERIPQFISNLNENLDILENIDVESKKSQEKIKSLTSEGLRTYILSVKEFIEDLSNIKEENPKLFIRKINNLFPDFDKKSYKSYQKATFLIGKEMANTKKVLVDFSKYIAKIFSENKEILESQRVTVEIESKLKQINQNKENLKNYINEEDSINEKIINFQEKGKSILNNIKEVKNSSEYNENIKRKEQIKQIESQVEIQIQELKNLINFKKLANLFHTSQSKLSIVKKHRENFRNSFLEDNGEKILNLINETSLKDSKISDQINKIIKINEEIQEKKSLIKEDEISKLNDEKRKINEEINNIIEEKNKQLKLNQRIKDNNEELKESIKSEMSKLNAIII